jgi:hypothetical protein
MAQKKKKSKQTPQSVKKRMPRSQKIMVIIGVFIIISMLLPALLSFYN